MTSLPHKKPRKPQLSKKKLRELLRKRPSEQELRDLLGPLARWIAREERYTLPETRDMQRRLKRGKGRPEIPNKFEILDAAAHAKVQEGRYTQIATQWKMTAQQLRDLVQNNRTIFRRLVRSLRKNARLKPTR